MVEPLAVGMQAAKKAAIKPGDVAVVMGCGTIGMVTAMAALAAVAVKSLSQTEFNRSWICSALRYDRINITKQDVKPQWII